MAVAHSFNLEPNDLGIQIVSFSFQDSACVFTAGSNSILCGLGNWRRSEASFPGTPPRLISGGKPKDPVISKIAASAAWSDDRTLVMIWRYCETPHSDRVTCRFEGDRVTITFLDSITAGKPKAKDSRAPLVGRLAS